MISKSKLRLFSLGGLEEIGKNCTVLEYNNEILVIDFGIKFNKDKLLGNLIYYPDFGYLEENQHKIKAILITHGHLDHIGGLLYLFKKINPLILTSNFTKDLIDNLFQKNNFPKPKINIIKDAFPLGHFNITPISLRHSIVDSIGFHITAREHSIFITGDFKEITQEHLLALKERKIDILLSDSTNANKNKTRITEEEIFNNLKEIIKNSSRVFLTHFSSQVYIIKNILDIAAEQDKIIIPLGRSIEEIFSILEKNQELLPYLNIIGSFKELNNYPQEKIIFLATGSQGEKNSSLWKLAHKKMKDLEIEHEDTLILSSSMIPGNEIYVNEIINSFYKQGAKVITNDDIAIHSSGHSYKNELREVINAIKPKFFIPIHGEYKHLVHHKDIAVECGVKENNVFIIENGETLELNQGSLKIGKKLKLKEKILKNNRHINSFLIEEKKKLAENGTMLINVYKNKDNFSIKINSLGMVNPEERSQLNTELEGIIHEKKILKENSEKKIKKNVLREVNSFLNNHKITYPQLILFNFLV